MAGTCGQCGKTVSERLATCPYCHWPMTSAYAPPAADPEAPLADGSYVIPVPGIAGVVSVTSPGAFTGAAILIDGRPAKKASRGSFWLPRKDGSTVEAKLAGTFGSPASAVIVDGVRYGVGPQIPGALMAIAMLPIGLMFVGGLLGGLIGGGAAAMNTSVARSKLATSNKVIAMLLVSATAAVLYFVAALGFEKMMQN